MQSKLSVILPVYNGEKSIARAIESVLKQSYKNIELIIIDDGSKDKTKNIISKYKEKDNRIKYIYKENGGVSSARNIGLKEVTGTYTTFIDSDDYISNEMYETLIRDLEDNNADIAIGNSTDVINNEIIYKKDDDNITIWNKEEIQKEVFLNKRLSLGLCDKIIKSDLLKKELFDEKLLNNEDKLFMHKVLSQTNKVVYRNKIFFYYVVRNDSAARSYSQDFYYSCLYVLDKINGMDYCKKYKDINNAETLIFLYRTLILNEQKKEYPEITKIIKSKVRKIKINKYFNKALALKCLIIKLSFNLYEIILTYYEKEKKKKNEIKKFII